MPCDKVAFYVRLSKQNWQNKNMSKKYVHNVTAACAKGKL